MKNICGTLKGALYMNKKDFYAAMANMGYSAEGGTLADYEAVKRIITRDRVLTPKQYEKYIRWIAEYLRV